MKTIALSAIKIAPNRQRRFFDPGELHAFGENIAATQLQNAIVLRIVGDDYVLVSGERRLRAIKDLAELGVCIKHDNEVIPCGFIPYTNLGDLDALAAEEAELDENFHRSDLTWQEEAAAVKRLHQLRSAQSAARGTPAPSTADIATEIRGSSEGSNQEATRRQLIVANYLDDPEVRGAKTTDEAFKVLKRKEGVERNRALGEQVGRTFTADLHSCFNEDSLAWLAACPAEQFDVILTDPPYGMGADEFGDSGGLAAGAHGYADTPEHALTCYHALATQGFRVTKPLAHLYAFCDIDLFQQLKELFFTAGWQVFRTPLIWHKPGGMRAPWPEHGPQRKYETLLYAIKGKRPVTKMSPDLFAYSPDSNLGHAAQKPVALFEDLLKRSVRPGDTVLDPFCGSGPVFAAAHALKCRATGIELDQASYGIAVKRIEQLKAQLDLGL